MPSRSILDADMATLARWLREGLAWWRAELAGMMPAAWRDGARRLRNRVTWHGPGRFVVHGKGRPGAVLVDPAACLVRELAAPPLSAADRARFVALEADRIFPLDPSRLVIGSSAPGTASGRLTVAAMPLAQARAMLDDLARAGIAPGTVGVAAPGAAQVAIDLSPALVAAGLLSARRDARTRWWALAAFLFAANLALLVWRDAQSLSQLEDLVAAQGPAVRSARAITARIVAAQAGADALVRRRRAHDALGTMAGVARALPATAWVQRYAWDGATIRLSGYQRADAQVAPALRSSGRFSEVRSAASEAMAEVQAGIPFDVTARVRAVGP